MARKRTSAERQVAETIVNSLLKTNSRRNKKSSGIFVLATLLLVIFGFLWTAISPRQDGIENNELDVTEEEKPAYANEGTFPEADDEDSDSVSETRFFVPDREQVTIERCVDGDTLIVLSSSGRRERVRLIGANTPETVKKNWPVEPFGPEASAYTKSRVEEAGNIATLVSDGNSYDRYNRRLAFVYLGDDNISLNEDLCRQGLAKAETKYSFSKEMKSRLEAAARAAEREGIGIYSLSR